MVARITWLACLATFLSAPQLSQAEGIFSSGGPDAGTPEYYYLHASDPVGARQKCHHGKLWPPFPRPSGPHQRCIHKYHAATYWPWPYVCQDRAVVYETSYNQIANGWLTATTLYDYHFDAQTHELNSSGRRHLAWIVSSVPEQYRRIVISAEFDSPVNQTREQSVHAEMAQLVGPEHTMPVVLQQSINPAVRNAGVVEQIHRSATDSMLLPVIQYTSVQGAAN